MEKILTKCPVCGDVLKIKTMQCNGCGLELKNEFEHSIFEKLSSDEYDFLIEFLRCHGNMKEVQNKLDISYPFAKKKLIQVIKSLGINECEENNVEQEEWSVDEMSTKASEIVKNKFFQAGGRADIQTANGKVFEVNADTKTIGSQSALHNVRYEWYVFDIICELLIEKGGEARKGNGRNYRVGEKGCTDDTIAGRIAKKYYGKSDGESTFDPVFILVAIMEWAGIVYNKRGYIELSHEYKKKLGW